MKTGMYIILCVHTVWLTNASIYQGKFTRGLGTCILLASFVGFPHLLTLLVLLYHTLTCTLHVYKPTVRPVARHRLFFDIQVGGTLVEKIHLVYTCKSLLPHYQTMLVFFNNICSTLAFVYSTLTCTHVSVLQILLKTIRVAW